MTTEATYPYAVGGVSSWCDLLVSGLSEIEWLILPIVAANAVREPAYEIPDHATLLRSIELWSDALPRRRLSPRADLPTALELPGVLVRTLMSWSGEQQGLIEALVSCRRRPDRVRRVFRSARGWESFLAGLQAILAEPANGPTPELDAFEAARLYQVLYWVARAAAAPTPAADLLHVTTAGWAAIPALVHKALHGTPLLLTEHGVYVRESYLATAQSSSSPGERFISTRLARGLARCAYSAADTVAPVTDANARWEVGLGVDPTKIRVIYNGVDVGGEPPELPGTATVVTVGRIDPLKDVHTTLRVAVEVLRRVPQAQFLFYGPATEGQESYERSCEKLRRRLGLGDRFRFMGPTSNAEQALRRADVFLMTSISEGLPLAILEAMAQGRPVVATEVGGVPDVVRGCGMLALPGDVHGLTLALVRLLRNPSLASLLGRRGYARVRRTFTRSECLNNYGELIGELASGAVAA